MDAKELNQMNSYSDPLPPYNELNQGPDVVISMPTGVPPIPLQNNQSHHGTKIEPEGYHSKNYENQIVWSIINAVFFFPYLFLWIPALVFATLSRKSYYNDNFRESSKRSNTSFQFNIACTIIGII